MSTFGRGGQIAREAIERGITPAVADAIAVAYAADGSGAVMRAAARELASHAGPAAAAEEVYRAADELISEEGE